MIIKKILQFQKIIFFFSLVLTLAFITAGDALAQCSSGCGNTLPCSDHGCLGCTNCVDTSYDAGSFFGRVALPEGVAQYGNFQTGLILFVNNLLKLIIIGAGVFALFNIVIAGYNFLSAGGDAKKVEAAWGRIWMSLLGLLFVAGSFVLAAVFGWIIFGDPSVILRPAIYGPPTN